MPNRLCGHITVSIMHPKRGMKKTRRITRTLGRTATLDTPLRAVQFLRTVGTDSNIAQALANIGFTAADRKHGWDLLCKASTSVDLVRRPPPKVDANEKLEDWRKAHMVIARAALAHLHPEQSAFVFGTPMRADTPTVVWVEQFLNHLDALERSPKRVSTRQADHAALATLDRRGITTQARKTARQLIAAVMHLEVMHPPNDNAKNEARAALLQLHAWLTDWSECARTIIQRRDQLLRLGIGRRQKRKLATPPGP